MTNEQATVNAGNKIKELKAAYVAHITPIVLAYRENGTEPVLADLLECQRLGNEYFNYAENFVCDSGLLGAHDNGKWVTGFAEHCKEILETYLIHAKFIKSWESKLGKNSSPSENAYSNMQRMVVEYLPTDQAKELKNKFIENNLSVRGFNVAAVPDKAKPEKWQLITSVCVGVVSLIASVIIALFFPHPTPYQIFILRGLFAIALASIGAIIPGFLTVKSGARSTAAYFGVYAGGAIAIFVLIWLVNPPEIQQAIPAADLQNSVEKK